MFNTNDGLVAKQWSKYLYDFAASDEYLESLKWLKRNGCPVRRDAIFGPYRKDIQEWIDENL